MTSRTRSLPVPLLLLTLLLGVLAVVVPPPGGVPPAVSADHLGRADRPDPPAARRVDKDDCRAIDPNLVRGACLRYETPQGSGLTWIGSYRAPDGRVFFCIDFLYDSRLPRRAERVSTHDLVNQLGDRVGDPEVAALNHLVSTWAADGSTGSDDRDAAIALIVREVMGDGTRPGGLVVYPAGLKVGGTVQPPLDGLDAATMALARSMWREASAHRGPWRLRLDLVGSGPVRVGQVRSYRLAVVSAAGRSVPGVRVRLQCWGPTTCPGPVTTGRRTTIVTLRPTDVGPFKVVARATGPASDGVLYREPGWSTHDGETARPAGVQRGWIAQSNPAVAAISAATRIEKAQPAIMTRTSHQVVRPGAAIHDRVAVKGLPRGYSGTVVAELHGPFDTQPGPSDCSRWTLAGRVSKRVTVDGTYDTPKIVVPAVGYYTWVQRLPGDTDALSVVTPCGLREETTRVVQRQPRVTTVVSDQRVRVGASLFDTVRLSGLAPDDRVTVRWRLHGPVAPRSGSCAELRWVGAPVVGSGSVAVTGSRTFRTPSVRVARAGCYTYSQDVLATPLTEAATSPPGLAVETSLVVRRTPRVATVVSDQRVLAGSRVFDTVRLSGLAADDRVVVRWRLHGPVSPRAGSSCAGLSWAGAPVVASGEVAVTGSRTFRTPSVRVARAGCYTYSQAVAATALTDPAVSPPGLATETSLVVPRTPAIRTIVSDQDARTGSRIFDTVRLSGLAFDDRVTVRWRLHGPLAPASGSSCAGVRWAGAPVAASGSVETVGNQVFRTPSVLLRRPGCYTYSQDLLATPATRAVTSPPGLAPETSLVTRPVTPVVPEVPTGRGPGLAPGAAGGESEPAASSYVPQRRAEPRWLTSDYRVPASSGGRSDRQSGRAASGALTISRVGIRLAVTAVGLDDGDAIAVPDERDRIGWLRTTAAHGDLIGASVLSAHVSDRPGEMGALVGVRRGDVVRWTDPSGRTERFEVRTAKRYPRTRGVPAELFRTNGQRVVHLITCTTLRRLPNGRIHYVDNLVVTAVRVG